MSTGSTNAKLPPKDKAGGDQNAPAVDQKDVLVDFWLRFSRFGWDALGVGLLAAALMSLLGLLGLTRGRLIDPWVLLLKLGFGWGSPLVILAFSILGLLSLRGHLNTWPRVSLGRVIALEMACFDFLTILAVFGGQDLAKAEGGQDGGVIGWGLAELLGKLLPLPWSLILLVTLLLFFIGYGSGVMGWGLRTLEAWLNKISSEKPVERAAPRKLAVEEEGEEAVVEETPPTAPVPRDPRLPGLDLLLEEQTAVPDEAAIMETGKIIERTLADFGLPVHVRGYRIGPTITQYAVEPGFVEKTGLEGEIIQQKVRVAQISTLQRDLALALSAERLRIEAPVPGRTYVGIEVPNPRNTLVRLRSLLEAVEFQKVNSPLAVALGKDVSGAPVIADLARMPHMLIAGTTGSGKSVCIAALITCLVVNNTPERLRLAMLDPKMVELSRFNGLPHLFGKVETEIDRMLGVLKWALMEMDNRYRLLETAHTRDVDTYNRRAEKRGQPTLPKIVVLIDELADLMMSAPDQTEHSLVRLAQMARATGIHLVVATQRPSTDVVTGLIKANFPARVAFTVASSIDSRVILDTTGAEDLLGKGDLLFLNPEAGTPMRAQGVIVTDQEIEQVAAFWQKQREETEAQPAPWEDLITQEDENGGDELVQQAIEIVKLAQRASASLLQRRLRIGYPRAARLIDQLEEMGVVGPSQGSGKDRDVLVDPDEESGDEDENPEDAA